MNFPNTLSPDLDTRAGRMLAAGRVKVTVTSKETGEHITILFKAFADNRNGEFKENGKRWEPCVLSEASHVFTEVPGASGEWADKVGTFYPRSGKWYSDNNADPARVYAAAAAAHWVNKGSENADPNSAWGMTFQEQDECARCGKELTDPVSIARGIGPVCLGHMTGSQHQVKVKEQIEQGEQEEMVIPAPGEVGSRKWLEDRTARDAETFPSAALSRAMEMVMSLDHADIERLIDYSQAVLQQDADDRPHLVGDRDQAFLGR